MGRLVVHSENGRLDWQALGYDGDPIVYGSQARKRALVAHGEAGDE